MRCLGITRELRRCRRDASDRWPFCPAHRRQWGYFLATFAVAVFSSYAAVYLPVLTSAEPQSAVPRQESKADVQFVAGGHERTRFWLYNAGRASAHLPKYGFVIYDLDPLDDKQPRRILHIPFALLQDYILPKRALGPCAILELSDRARQVPVGHRVFGYATVQCENCLDRRVYWLFFTNGTGGWYRQLTPAEASVANRTLAAVVYARDRAVEQVDRLIPVGGRVALDTFDPAPNPSSSGG